MPRRVINAGIVTAIGGQQFERTLVRYRANGTLDPAFGSGGIVTTDFGDGIEAANALAVQNNGRLVAAGVVNNTGFDGDFGLARDLAR